MISKANSRLGFITIVARWALGTFPSCSHFALSRPSDRVSRRMTYRRFAGQIAVRKSNQYLTRKISIMKNCSNKRRTSIVPAAG